MKCINVFQPDETLNAFVAEQKHYQLWEFPQPSVPVSAPVREGLKGLPRAYIWFDLILYLTQTETCSTVNVFVDFLYSTFESYPTVNHTHTYVCIYFHF